ncbi:MAG: hypothetical protein ACRC6D_14615 [Aeromonas sp.]
MQTTPPSYYKNYGYEVGTGFIWKQVYPGQTLPTPPTGSLYYNGTNVEGIILDSDNQVLGTDGAGQPAALSIVAGEGIDVVQSGQTLTVTNTSIGAVTSWSAVSTNTQMIGGRGYIVSTPAIMTLPPAGTLGESIIVIALIAGVEIAQNADQQIQYPSSNSIAASTTLGVAGSYTSAVAGAIATLVATDVTATRWIVQISGNWIPQ